ncbi:Ceramide glucosyltransferase [Cryptotrichosporon argae]
MSGGMLSLMAAVILIGFWAFVWALGLLGLRTARNKYTGPALPSPLSARPASSVPGVTIIRPLCGLDSNMYSTLESVMRQDYPKFEVLFAVQDPDDEALPVVRMVMEKYPEVSSRIISNPEKVGVNPKVNNLMAPFAEAAYDLLWVVDVTIAVQPSVLGRLVSAFMASPTRAFDVDDVEAAPLLADDVRKPPSAGDVGLVHQVPYAVVCERTWGSLIEQAYLNSTHAKMYLAINAVAIESCVVGKSNLYSRASIASLTTPSPTLRQRPDPPTGLAGFAPFLAEDNMLALSLWHELGLKHALSPDVALDFLSALSVRQYVARRARWIRVRKHMTFAATLLEPLTESVVAGVYGSWALARLIGADRAAVFTLHMAAWLAVDLGVRNALATRVRAVGPQTSLPVFVAAWAMRELLALPVWLYGMSGSDVVWRGRKYTIVGSGEAI